MSVRVRLAAIPAARAWRHNESSLLLLSSGWPSFFEVGFCGEGVPAVVPGRMVVSGPGVAGPKSWRSGC